MIKSLRARKHQLAEVTSQLEILSGFQYNEDQIPFSKKIREHGWNSLNPSAIDILQLNLGYMCNQSCKHCHVDAGPDRKEIMSREIMKDCLEVIKNHSIKTVDLTGGAPEMNSDFRWFVEHLSAAGVGEIIVRSNLTILLANPKYHDLPEFFKRHSVRVISSLPFYQKSKTDRQRGEGVFSKSIEALKRLNAAGYGTDNSSLKLDLVYNPAGAFLPGDQAQLEKEYKRELKKEFDIDFNNLFTITNMPISRFLEFLVNSGNYDDYMEKLLMSFNPAAIDGLMCRNTLSVGYDGYLYDCDFNQMLGMKIDKKHSEHISEFNYDKLLARNIKTNQHCYGCTAGAGSSCQGTVAKQL